MQQSVSLAQFVRFVLTDSAVPLALPRLLANSALLEDMYVVIVHYILFSTPFLSASIRSHFLPASCVLTG
jgi:hypothetical protein